MCAATVLDGVEGHGDSSGRAADPSGGRVASRPVRPIIEGGPGVVEHLVVLPALPDNGYPLDVVPLADYVRHLEAFAGEDGPQPSEHLHGLLGFVSLLVGASLLIQGRCQISRLRITLNETLQIHYLTVIVTLQAAYQSYLVECIVSN